jgi:urea carboxylase
MFPLKPIFQSDPREDTSFISYTNTQPTDPAIGSIDAPTASNVWKMQVEAGQTLSSGQTVAILEAMKMEINVDVPPDWSEAKVERVLVQPGEVVKAGDRLVLLRKH